MEIDKISYLRKFLTKPENELFERIYKTGIKNKARAIQQIERTLENREEKRLEIEKKFKQHEKEIEQIKLKHKNEIELFENKIEETKKMTISTFDKDDFEINKRLDKLQALENGGVDNWEWYCEALSAWGEKYD